MINDVYSTTLVILNKEINGYISPTEFNAIAQQVQEEIFYNYFSESYKDAVKLQHVTPSNGYSNLSFTQRQRINNFSDEDTLTSSTGIFTLPSDLYLIEESGITSAVGDVVEEVEKREFSYLANSLAKPDVDFPIYERYPDTIKVVPATIAELNIRYIRKPRKPNWTYNIVSGKELYNPGKSTHQDFDLDPAEFSNIVIRMCAYFGVNLRERDVIQVMENYKNQTNIKENA